MLKMKVKQVGFDPNTMHPVVVITDTEERGAIPILIGAAEYNAITAQLEGMQYPRPMTHDLLRDSIEALNAKVDRIIISELRDETYYARILLKNKDGEVAIDARPSDALALALRCEAPIFVSEEVAAQAVIAPQIDDAEMAEFRKFVEEVKPGDFEKRLFG